MIFSCDIDVLRVHGADIAADLRRVAAFDRLHGTGHIWCKRCELCERISQAGARSIWSEEMPIE